MKKVICLFLQEFKNIYKQLILFIIISVFLFALAIGLFCFAKDMRSAYRQYMDATCTAPLSIFIENKINKTDLSIVNSFVDTVWSSSVVSEGTLSYNEKEVSSNQPPEGFAYLIGQSCYFKDSLPMSAEDIKFTEGRFLGDSINGKDEEGYYHIYLSNIVAEPLDAHLNDVITWNYNGYSANIKIAGIYDITSYGLCFILPINILYEFNEEIFIRIDINKPSDSITICPRLTSMGLDFNSSDWPLESNTVVLQMETIFYILALVICALTCFILSNILSITLRTRKKFIAKLKLLGTADKYIRGIYFSWLIVAFIISFTLGIILANFLCVIFSRMGELILLYPVTIVLDWVAIFLIGLISLLTLGVRFLLFRKSISKIAPIELVKEE